MNVDRNIYRLMTRKGPRFKVVLTRREPSGQTRNLYGGRFDSLSAARESRDRLERAAPGGRPWAYAPRLPERRTVYTLRAERLAAGLCQSCGQEPARPGRKSCARCVWTASMKRALRRAAA